MGLIFLVGNGSHAFMDPYGANLDSAFREHFPGLILPFPEEEGWSSQEVAWSGWKSLQQRASTALGASAVPPLLSMPAWKGVYLPVEIEPCALSDVSGEDSPLEVASLDRLLAELEAFGRASGLPIDEAGLGDLAARFDEDDVVKTYAQLFLAGYVARRARCPLWIVK